jgi:hypothetical protein
MTMTKTWSVEIFINERDGDTHAEARLRTGDRTALLASGTARLNPADRDVPEIGDELAVARALSALGHRLVEAAAGDIEAITHRRATLQG